MAPDKVLQFPHGTCCGIGQHAPCGKKNLIGREYNIERYNTMINFEEELKKFRPSLEVEDAEESIYNQDLTDMADLLVRMLQEVQETEDNDIAR